MNAPKKQTPPIEGHFLIPGGWDKHIALPMSLASAVMPHIKIVEREYKDGKYTCKLNDVARKDLEIRMLTSEEMTALVVAERLTREE